MGKTYTENEIVANLESVATFDWPVVLFRGICQILMQFVKRSAQQAM